LALAIVAGVGGGYGIWVHTESSRLDEAIERLRREGEPVAPADLTRPGVPPGHNAVFDLRSAALLIDDKSPAWKAFQAGATEETLSEETKQAMRTLLESPGSRQALALVRAARAKPAADWQVPMRSPLVSLVIPDLAAQRNVGELCRAAALDAQARGDHGTVLETARDLLGVSRALESHPSMVGYFQATGTIALATYLLQEAIPALRVAPGNGSGESHAGEAGGGGDDSSGGKPATAEQVWALIADLLDEKPRNQSFVQALRDERVMELDTAQAVADGRMTLDALSGAYGAKSGGVPLVPRAMILSDARLILDYTTGVLHAVQKSPDYPTLRQNAPTFPIAPSTGPGPGGHALARLLLPSFENGMKTHYRCMAETRMAATALAIKWYQADHHGRAPQSLEELVPKYLPSVPADPFATRGTPLRFLPPARGLAVYSVGENMKDDGGSDAPVNPARKSTVRWDQKDALFWAAPKPVDDEDD
jgi:hypothetical protein